MIPFIQPPDLAGTPLRQSTPSAAALGAPAQALGDFARGIAEIGGAFAQHAGQLQSIENARLESEARQLVAAELADFKLRADTATDPASLLPDLEKTIERTSSVINNPNLPPILRERLSLWHSDTAAQAKLQTAADASRLALRRAGLALQNEMDSAVQYGDSTAFEDVLSRGQEAGLLLPEEAEERRTKFAQAQAHQSLIKAIEADPQTTLDQLQSDDILQRVPNLTETNRQQLIRYATQRTNQQKAETWEQIQLASLDGTILSREDIMQMAKEGEITPAQAGSYLNAYHGTTEPQPDSLLYSQARALIHSYDPAQDQTGEQRAEIRRQLATLPLPKEHIKELSTQFSAILNPTAEEAPKHKLAADYMARIETEWKSEAFGEWFDMEKDPIEGRIARKIIRADDFDKAVAYRQRVQDHFIGWLNQQKPDISPDEVGKKYKEIKAQALDATAPLDFTPSNAPAFDDIDDLIVDPATPPDTTTPPTTLPRTSIIPDAYKREATIPYTPGGPPANVRYNNPGAAWPRPADVKYGLIGYGKLNDGEGNKIGRFPTPVHGAAANFDLFASNYVGMTMRDAMRKWRGRPSPTPKGYDPNAVIDQNFLNNPAKAIDFFKKMALNESPEFKMSDDQWKQAWQLWKTTTDKAPKGTLSERKTAFFQTTRPRSAEEALTGLADIYDQYHRDQALS